MDIYIYIYNYSNNKNDKSVSTNLIQAIMQTTSLNYIIITIPVWQSTSIKTTQVKNVYEYTTTHIKLFSILYKFI